MSDSYIPGIPEALPPGEELLWTGRPDARIVARAAFKERWIMAYFAGLAILAGLAGGTLGSAAARSVWVILLGAVVVGLIRFYAHLTARTTTYALTNRRVVMEIGVAFPSIFNLPFSRLGGALSRLNGDGSGDIVFQIAGSDRIGYLLLWPHVRPWKLREPEPMFRGLTDAEQVAAVARDALLAAGVGTRPPGEKTRVDIAILDEDGTRVMSNEPTPRTPAHA